MLISEYAKVKINSSNKYHFLELGYNNLIIKEEIIVLVDHLTRYSSSLITVKCDVCGNIKETTNHKYLNNIKKYNIF